MHLTLSWALTALITAFVPAPVPPDATWPQFRGPAGRAVSTVTTLPASWSTTINVAWTTEVPGRGWSSPIVWGDQVMLTSAVGKGAFKQPSPGIYGNDYVAELQKQGLGEQQIMEKLRARDLESPQEIGELQFMVYSFDVRTGRLRWARQAHTGLPVGGRHRKNTYASETLATDGERVYALFGNIGLFAFTMDGTPLWTYEIDPQPRYLDFGTAASPVVHDGRVYIVDDNEKRSFIAAIDAKSGKEIWRTPRTGLGRILSGWSTPFVWVNAVRTEIVTIGPQLAISYGLDGRELWRLKGLTQANPTPTEGEGLLYIGTGSQGEANRPLFAIRPGGSGDISLAPGAAASQFVAWFQPRASAYTSSPLVFGGRVYAVNDTGVLQVFDAKTGKELYKARVGGVGNTFSASPWACGGKVFFLSEEGDTFVIRPGDTYEEIGRNSLGEMALASPAVTRDGLFVRTQSRLYRIR
ncbi:MAG TPA: PQQ-binding-like beta-propeller repeat protein [Vicinamibacterales bacterium]|nr:PQQ-binding-like beta-propeller repeat protein [Vicinamibacterales bacterium]